MPLLLREALRELRDKRGMSRGALSRATVRLGYGGVPEATIEAYETRPGQVPKAEVLEVLAEALGVDPVEFYEWPIAVAKRDGGSTRSLAEIAEGAARRRADTTSQPRKGRGGKPGKGRAA